MPHQTYVVATGGDLPLYLTGYNPNDPPNSIFGNLSNAIEYETLEDARTTAQAIGGGTVGTTHP